MEVLLLFLIMVFPIALIIGLLPAAIANSKGHSFFGWWVYGFLLFIIALPHALLLEKASVPTGQTRYGTNITRIYIRKNNEQYGPYSVGYVRAWLDSGRLDGTELAWHEGCPSWMPLSSMFDDVRISR
jgi:hypothetical protein